MHMEMPKPGAEHRTLAKMAGIWVGEEKLHPSPWDPKGGTATGRVEARMDLDGFALISDYTQERDGKVVFRGHGVYGWDRSRERYFMTWFDSMSGGLPSTCYGNLEGDTITFENKSEQGLSRYIYKLESETAQGFRIESSQDGKTWMTFLETRYTRK